MNKNEEQATRQSKLSKRAQLWKQGKTGCVYGIWNGISKRFVFGIRAETPAKAQKQFTKINPKGGYCWRYEVKPIPPNWINPKNDLYKRI